MINDGRRPATFTPLRGDSWEEEIARVFRSSLPPLGVAASAQFQISNFKFQVSSFKFPLPFAIIRVHSRFRLHLCVVAMNFFPANLRQGKAFFPGFARR